MPAKQRQIKDAIATYLAGITIAGGYFTNLNATGQVLDQTTSYRNMTVFPAVQVRYGVQEKNHVTYGDRRTNSVSSFDLLLAGATENVLADVAADVEKRLVTPDGAGGFLGLTGIVDIEEITVTGTEPAEVAEEIGRGIRWWVLTLTVSYLHLRGTA